MNIINFQSDKFYAVVSYLSGSVTYQFSTQEEQDNFIQDVEQSAEVVYALTPQQIKLEAHRQLSLKYAGGIAYLIVRKLEKEVAYDKHAPRLAQIQHTVKALLTELSPYLINHHASSEEVNLQIHINKQLPLANAWHIKSCGKRNASVNFTNYLHAICAVTVDHKLTPPKKLMPLKK